MYVFVSLLRIFCFSLCKIYIFFYYWIYFGCFRFRMSSILDDFDVIGIIGLGLYGICKKIRRKKDGKVKFYR